MTARERIFQKMQEFLEQEPEGIRYSVFVKKLGDALPDIPRNTIHGTIWNAEAKHPDIFYKPVKGLFRLTKFKGDELPQALVPPQPKPSEEQFYAAFAEYLVEELEECSKAIPLGGHKFREKRGTPDVIGVLKPGPTDIFKFPTEIVSAEIKSDFTSLITAFGQACAYKLFSHKSYIVVPASSPQEDLSRLDSLCMIFGIGLIVFDLDDPKEPNFRIQTRAVRHEPDMFYVNKNVKEVANELLS